MNDEEKLAIVVDKIVQAEQLYNEAKILIETTKRYYIHYEQSPILSIMEYSPEVWNDE